MDDVEATRGLRKNESLAGANPSFDFTIFNQPEDNEDWTESKVLDPGTPINQLSKVSDPVKAHTEFDWEKFSHGEKIRVWASSSLDVDFDLQATEERPACTVDQFFILCTTRPPLLLGICGKKDNILEVEDYTQLIASRLHSRLLDFCHLDFRILPLAILENELTVDTIERVLGEKISDVKRYHQGRLLLTNTMMSMLTSATTALSSVTFVYGLLHGSSSDDLWLLLMNSSWRSKLHSFIEQLGAAQKIKILSVGKKSPTDAGLVTGLEAAVRLSVSQNIRLTFNTKRLETNLQRLIKYYNSQMGVKLQLQLLTKLYENASLVVEVVNTGTVGSAQKKMPAKTTDRKSSVNRKKTKGEKKVTSADREKRHKASPHRLHRWATE